MATTWCLADLRTGQIIDTLPDPAGREFRAED